METLLLFILYTLLWFFVGVAIARVVGGSYD
jgi:hypothetical protein